MRILIISIFVLIFYSCNSSSNEIIGKWAYIKNIEDGKEIIKIASHITRQIEFLPTKEIFYYNDDDIIGVGTYSYYLKDDTLMHINKQVNPNGRIKKDTIKGAYSIKNDTLILSDKKEKTYFKRSVNN